MTATTPKRPAMTPSQRVSAVHARNRAAGGRRLTIMIPPPLEQRLKAERGTRSAQRQVLDILEEAVPEPVPWPFQSHVGKTK